MRATSCCEGRGSHTGDDVSFGYNEYCVLVSSLGLSFLRLGLNRKQLVDVIRTNMMLPVVVTMSLLTDICLGRLMVSETLKHVNLMNVMLPL